MSVNTLTGNTALNQASGALLKRKVDLGAGEKGFAQINVIGDGFTPLDHRVIYFLVPPRIPDPNGS